MRILLIIVLGFSLVGTSCLAEDIEDIGNEKAKVNYSVGFQIGDDFRRQGVEINPEFLVRGIQDALSGKIPLMTKEEQRATLVNLQRQVDSPQKPDDSKQVQE